LLKTWKVGGSLYYRRRENLLKLKKKKVMQVKEAILMTDKRERERQSRECLQESTQKVASDFETQ